MPRRDPSKPRAIEVPVERAEGAHRVPRDSRWSVRSRRASRSSPRRTTRTTSRCPTASAARTATTPPGTRRVHEGRRHPRGRLRRCALQEARRATGRSSSPCSATRPPSSASSGIGSHPAPAGQRGLEPIRTRDVRLLGRVVGVFSRLSTTVLAVLAETRLFEPSGWDARGSYPPRLGGSFDAPWPGSVPGVSWRAGARWLRHLRLPPTISFRSDQEPEGTGVFMSVWISVGVSARL